MPEMPQLQSLEATCVVDEHSDLVSLRVFHSRCWARLVIYAEYQGILLAAGEGYVMQERKVRMVGTTAVQRQQPITMIDAVHMKNSLHYVGTADDGVVWKRQQEVGRPPVYTYVEDGTDPVWKQLGEYWESLHPLCVWGGRFGDVDHFSVKYQGRE